MNATQIDALAKGGTFSGKTLQGTVEETHISWVILAGRFAFKIKKPLRLSFLDFSTLALRKQFCEKEVRLNSRFSDIYLGVVPVTYSHGIWRLGEAGGTIRDYAVKMKRMDSSKRMDFLIQSGKVTGKNILALAKSISSFHVRANIISADLDLRFCKKAFNDIRLIRPFISKTCPKRYSSILKKAIPWSDSFLRLHARRLRERIALGYKRDLHGDLHSGNIFLYKRPVIFDCIEFNDQYRQIDAIDEVAFFCMDLEAYGHKDLSGIFMKAYVKMFRCVISAEDNRIFNYFKCYRANVRAKVHALAAAQRPDPAQYRNHVKAARKYLLLMKEYIDLDRIGFK